MEYKLLNKKYHGIFISWHKFWKGIYVHIPWINNDSLTIRIFLFGIDWYKTKRYNGK